MRIAFLTPWDVDSPRSWSGVVTPMFHALEKKTEVVAIETHGRGVAALDRALMGVIGRTSSRAYLSGHSVAGALRCARYVPRMLARSQVDVVVAVGASQEIAFSKLQVPIVQVTDATFEAIRDYYPLFANLHPVSAWQGALMARAAQRKTTAYAVASTWARDSLISDYGAPPETCRVIPFGPAVAPEAPPDRDYQRGLRVLTVCSDWKRKGGDVAVEAMRGARALIPDATLTVVGNAPANLPEWVRSLGVLDRSLMPQVYSDHDVLLELAEANAGGVTLTDAHAFGLPVIATDTGGVGTIVEDRVSGHLVRKGDDLVDEVISTLVRFGDKRTLRELSQGARNRYAELLNWDKWADDVLETCQLARDLYGEGTPSPQRGR